MIAKRQLCAHVSPRMLIALSPTTQRLRLPLALEVCLELGQCIFQCNLDQLSLKHACTIAAVSRTWLHVFWQCA